LENKVLDIVDAWCAHEIYVWMVLFLRLSAKRQKVTSSFVLSVCPSIYSSTWNNMALSGWIFMKLDIWKFLWNLSTKYKFNLNWIRITGTLHEDKYTFLIISHSVLLRMRSILNKHCRENHNTHIVFNYAFMKIVPLNIVWKLT